MHTKDPAHTTLSRKSTRLTRLHPYPAMVADSFAIELAQTYVPTGARILDPFCGSGRLLVAASHASHRTGFDVNPLAWLLTKAKLGAPSPQRVQNVIEGLEDCRSIRTCSEIDPKLNGGVDWFSSRSANDLEKIVRYLNTLNLPEAELLLVAAALSATVRQVSFARQGAWKLHRIGADLRSSFNADAFELFQRRLHYCVDSLSSRDPIEGTNDIRIVKAQNALRQPVAAEVGLFDVVLTSPPYGDSRTTVQYGAASALCLSIVSRLHGLEELSVRGAVIDSECLGGPASQKLDAKPLDLEPYWRSSEANLKRSVERFVLDYNEAMVGIANALRPDGTVIFVVGNRSVGGARFALDQLTIDQAARVGLELYDRRVRKFETKRVPRSVNRFGRSTDGNRRAAGKTETMAEEVVLVMRPG